MKFCVHKRRIIYEKETERARRRKGRIRKFVAWSAACWNSSKSGEKEFEMRRALVIGSL
jgi:hypothetical protein